MLKRFALIGVLLSSVSVVSCLGQLCQSTHQTDLYCLIPAAFKTPASPFSAFYTPFGTELSQLPIAKPAGLVLKFEHGVLSSTSESMGPFFSERAETIGQNRIFLGATFQYFVFSSIDGNGLGSIPIILTAAGASASTPVYTVTNNRFDIKVAQYTIVAAYGLTNKIDVSVAVPLERVVMSVGVNGTEYEQGFNPASFTEYVPGSSSGLGDLTFGGKGTILDTEKITMAAGLDVRLPTGDELNFLGSGTVGFRPYLALSKRGRVSPHLNVGVQRNGESILNPDSLGNKQQLPTDFFYAAGVDAGLTKRVTLVADLLGHYYFNAPRLLAPRSYANLVPGLGPQMSVFPTKESYTETDFSLGAKGLVFHHLVFTGNVLIKLDNGGLRAKATPLVGLSYSF
jgi:Putative MetA-pathway of phenol degradation